MPPDDRARLFVDPKYAGRISTSRERLLQETGGSQEFFALAAAYWRRVDKRDPNDVQYLRDLYDAEIRNMDGEVGGLLARLRELGLERDTLVVFLSDHGEEFLEHGGFKHASLYQEVMHVPLIARFPGADPRLRARRVPELVGLVDVMPTVLELLGVAPPARIHGRSLLPLLRGEAWPPRPVFSAWGRAQLRALRDGRFKHVRRWSREELYDLQRDPGERQNLAGVEQGTARKLAAEAERLEREAASLLASVGPGKPVEPDAETRERLRALGYIDRE
jgi:arylsulfatase A-like enzyme